MISQLCFKCDKLCSVVGWLKALSLLAARLWMAKVFFTSGLTKIDNWKTTLALFEYEYDVPVISFELAAYMATGAELVLPILLVLGLLTPFAALGLFVMTAIIELFIFPGTTDHYHWLLLTGILVTHGSGKLGIDYWAMKCHKGKCSS